jgi:hypothetical protein
VGFRAPSDERENGCLLGIAGWLSALADLTLGEEELAAEDLAIGSSPVKGEALAVG